MEKAKRPSFQFYWKDWLSDINLISMSRACEGDYIRLLCICWGEGSIPADFRHLLKPGWTEDDLRVVANCFEVNPEDTSRLFHPRLKKEKEKQDEWIKKCKKGGNNSAKSRKLKKKNEDGVVELPLQVNPNTAFASSSTSSSPINKKQGCVNNNKNLLPPNKVLLIFDQKYLGYLGEKDNKELCKSLWQKQILTEEDLTKYEKAEQNYYSIVKADRNNGFERKLKGASNWFSTFTEYINQTPSGNGTVQEEPIKIQSSHKKKCQDQLKFVLNEIKEYKAKGEELPFMWFYMAIEKYFIDYQSLYNSTPFTEKEQELFDQISDTFHSRKEAEDETDKIDAG